MKIRYLLIQIAAWLANRRPAPREYSLSNPGNPIQNFCYFGFVRRDDDIQGQLQSDINKPPVNMARSRFTARSVQIGRGFSGFYYNKKELFDINYDQTEINASFPL